MKKGCLITAITLFCLSFILCLGIIGTSVEDEPTKVSAKTATKEPTKSPTKTATKTAIKTPTKKTSTKKPTPKPTTKPTKTKKGYDQSITFDQLNRDPDSYTGKGVVFTGTVIQVMKEKSGDTFRIDVGSGNILLCNYQYKAKELRIVEDDVIRFEGVSLGLYTYKTVLGASQTVPWVYIDSIVSR